MKLKSHTVAKLANNRARLDAIWTDQMRRPHHVSIAIQPAPSAAMAPMVEDEAGDLFKLFSGFAEIAWEMGWRPQGLAATLGHVVTSFKLPAKE